MRQISRQSSPQRYVALGQSGKRARQALRQAVDELRVHIPGFLPNSDAADLERASYEQALVYIVPSRDGGLAIAIYRGEVWPVWLPALTNRELRAHLRPASVSPTDDHPNTASVSEHSSQNISLRDDWLQYLDHLVPWLAENVMEPVVCTLEHHGVSEAVLVPTRALSLLPLHAATPATSITWRYAPYSRVLCTRRSTDTGRSGITRALVVGDPDGTLPYASVEVASVTRALDCQSTALKGEEANAMSVIQGLPGTQVWHLACHGRLDTSEVLQSGLRLAGDEWLTLRTLLGLSVSPRLAVLSACDAGMIGGGLPDEVISLPTALIYAGAEGVISPMWPVDDTRAAITMIRFYEEWQSGEVTPSRALKTTQAWLRGASNYEIARYLYTRGDGWREGAFGFMLSHAETRPYSHPCY